MSSQVTRRPIARPSAPRSGLWSAWVARAEGLGEQGSRALNVLVWVMSLSAVLVIGAGLQVLSLIHI